VRCSLRAARRADSPPYPQVGAPLCAAGPVRRGAIEARVNDMSARIRSLSSAINTLQPKYVLPARRDEYRSRRILILHRDHEGLPVSRCPDDQVGP